MRNLELMFQSGTWQREGGRKPPNKIGKNKAAMKHWASRNGMGAGNA